MLSFQNIRACLVVRKYSRGEKRKREVEKGEENDGESIFPCSVGHKINR